MSKCALLYFVVGVFVTTASYAFFSEWTQMPMQMMQGMTQPQTQPQTQAQQPIVCACDCN
jgi:hypothetical protein